jgi:hypothetical protein
VPPGFKDKRKKEGGSANADGEEVVVGSNRWGDLVFWQEILEHVLAHRVRTVAILTKDGKNDWRMAGTLPVRGETNGKGSGVQPPHPMLSFEAALTANAQELVLLDQRRLADVMKQGRGDVAGFIAAAQPPSLPPPKTESEVKAEVRQRHERDQIRIAEGAAKASNLRFLDPSGLNATKGVMPRALYQTRDDAAPITAVETFEQTVARVAGAQAVCDLLNAEAVASLGGAGLISLGRRIVTAGQSDAQWAAAANDLTAALETFPNETASFLYMGLLAGTYFDGMNKLLRIPNGLVAQKLFLLLDRPLAAIPIEQICSKAKAATQRPLYLPSDPRPIGAEIKVDTELDRENALRSVWVADLELLVDVQSDPALQLVRRFGTTPLTSELVLDHIADLYSLPRRQLAPAGFVNDAGYTFDEYMGFRAPQDVWRDRSEEKK